MEIGKVNIVSNLGHKGPQEVIIEQVGEGEIEVAVIKPLGLQQPG